MATSRSEWMEKLGGSTKVDFLSNFQGDNVLLHSKDRPFVEALKKKGASVTWFDRTAWETRAGGEPRMQAEVILGPKFFGEEA